MANLVQIAGPAEWRAPLSGTNIAPGVRDEVMRVLGWGERLTFTMNQPGRNLNDESELEALAAD